MIPVIRLQSAVGAHIGGINRKIQANSILRPNREFELQPGRHQFPKIIYDVFLFLFELLQ